MDTIGSRIKYVRELLGASQQSLAEKFGLSRGAIGNWELDKGVKADNILLFADIVGPGFFYWFATGKGAAPETKEALADSRVSSNGEPVALLPVIEASVHAAVQTMDESKGSRFRDLVYKSVLQTLVDPPKDEAPLPEEVRSRILLEAEGLAVLDTKKTERSHRKTLK